MDYPKQEHKSSGQRAPVSRRDVIDIYADAAAGGSANPSYTNRIAENLRAEVLQVSGGEFVRGRQVEGVCQFVISCRHIPELAANSRCKITIKSGIHSGQDVYTHRVYLDRGRSRAKFMDMHCRGKD